MINGKILTPLIAFVISMIAINSPVNAQTMPGCDEALVFEAMKDKAKLRVLYDVGVSEQIIKRPDSVLLLTCFGKAAAVSGERGGAIFSGDFKGDISSVISQTVTAMVENFEGGTNANGDVFSSSMGLDPDFGEVLRAEKDSIVADITTAANFQCTNMQDLWEATILSQPINQSAPNATFVELLASITGNGGGGIPNAGNELQGNMDSPSGVLVVEAARTHFPNGTNPGLLPEVIIPAFSGTQTLCEVLTAAGLGPC